MDAYERAMCRERAKWRSKLPTSQSLWRVADWKDAQTEDHHVARRKYGDTTIAVPFPMHCELTRRQMEEHPPEGPDPSDPSERWGRHALGYVDILECVADVLRAMAEDAIKNAGRPGLQNRESAYVLKLLRSFLLFVLQGFDEHLNETTLLE